MVIAWNDLARIPNFVIRRIFQMFSVGGNESLRKHATIAPEEDNGTQLLQDRHRYVSS